MKPILHVWKVRRKALHPRSFSVNFKFISVTVMIEFQDVMRVLRR
ncbi:MAG: hypothetical protein JWO45_2094 [Spartobacteria bacterium]|nr:hypothetical protein [Spartobacteria bacterium]